MKIVVLAQIPPPLHGQSKMVKLFLDCLCGDDSEIEPIHLNFKFSEDLTEIGRFQLKKCFQIVLILWQLFRIRYSQFPDVLYYVPAPAKRLPIFRDYLILLVVRCLFKKIVLHWQAVGIGQWSQLRAGKGILGLVDKSICEICYKDADLSIALSELTRSDAEIFKPKKMTVIPNGIPDPCPDFKDNLLPRRLERSAMIKPYLNSSRVDSEGLKLRFLFLSHCTKEKGLFDALRGLEILAENFLNEGKGISIRFDVAGVFPDKNVKKEFLRRTHNQKLVTVIFHDFVSGNKKDRLLREADGMVFPTYYENEGFPLTLIEALAYGLPVVASRWRGIPELLGDSYPFLVLQKNPEFVAEKVRKLLVESNPLKLRQRFEEYFTEGVFKSHIQKILSTITAS